MFASGWRLWFPGVGVFVGLISLWILLGRVWLMVSWCRLVVCCLGLWIGVFAVGFVG